MRKLCEIRVDELHAKEILSDVFGSCVDNTYFEGLLDSADFKDFIEKLEMLEPKWNVASPDFAEWFRKHEAKVICSTMIASVQATAGLGYPPKVFTNSNESLNSLLKQKVDFKSSEWPKFHKALRVINVKQHT